MEKLEDMSTATLKAALADATEGKAVKRIMIALAYKDGEDVTRLADRYGIPQSTIYYWLDRFEERPLSDAVADDPRPGRPRKLSAEQRAAVRSWLEHPPGSSTGDGASRWTAARLRERISEEFDVEYSTAHVYRMFLE